MAFRRAPPDQKKLYAELIKDKEHLLHTYNPQQAAAGKEDGSPRAQDGDKNVEDGPQRRQDSSEVAQDSLIGPQDGSNMVPRWSQDGSQDGSSWFQGVPKLTGWLKIVLRLRQNGPSLAKHVPGWPKMVPRWAEVGSLVPLGWGIFQADSNIISCDGSRDISSRL